MSAYRSAQQKEVHVDTEKAFERAHQFRVWSLTASTLLVALGMLVGSILYGSIHADRASVERAALEAEQAKQKAMEEMWRHQPVGQKP